jgi:hypothetical protein
MAGGIWVEIATAAGPGIGGGIGFWSGLRFIRWAVEFSFKRSDARNDRMDVRERALEERFNSRLVYVERELNRTRKALMLMINDTAQHNPTSAALQRAVDILGTDDENISGPMSRRSTVHGDTADRGDSLDELIERADKADPHYQRPSRRAR